MKRPTCTLPSESVAALLRNGRQLSLEYALTFTRDLADPAHDLRDFTQEPVDFASSFAMNIVTLVPSLFRHVIRGFEWSVRALA